ncbi:hypothetical protein FN846DRAFT_939809 [Sphaerosporella brunnea]|uniref:Uncharacterized protein n=1 Tax=Sphaerosporella brunnea TaxID=1250544 RepID=A0A5J5F2D9_9PEZI|nr:hypothetical protein FN846DRAFT_939791 [Sphaerosporella brunnea]KAA8910078.1 hypothetical protein FN846DRAFT_939809 [Sphaerosporella brunnea]
MLSLHHTSPAEHGSLAKLSSVDSKTPDTPKRKAADAFGESTKSDLMQLGPGGLEVLLEAFVINLGEHPDARSEETIKLPYYLLSSSRTAPSTNVEGQRREEIAANCGIHACVNEKLLDELDKLLRQEAYGPPSGILGTFHWYNSYKLRGVFNPTIADLVDLSLFDDDVDLYSPCAGCRIRRILSDRVFLRTLLVSTYIRPSQLTPIVEGASKLFGSRILGLKDADVAAHINASKIEAKELGAEAKTNAKKLKAGEASIINLFLSTCGLTDTDDGEFE